MPGRAKAIQPFGEGQGVGAALLGHQRAAGAATNVVPGSVSAPAPGIHQCAAPTALCGAKGQESVSQVTDEMVERLARYHWYRNHPYARVTKQDWDWLPMAAKRQHLETAREDLRVAFGETS